MFKTQTRKILTLCLSLSVLLASLLVSLSLISSLTVSAQTAPVPITVSFPSGSEENFSPNRLCILQLVEETVSANLLVDTIIPTESPLLNPGNYLAFIVDPTESCPSYEVVNPNLPQDEIFGFFTVYPTERTLNLLVFPDQFQILVNFDNISNSSYNDCFGGTVFNNQPNQSYTCEILPGQALDMSDYTSAGNGINSLALRNNQTGELYIPNSGNFCAAQFHGEPIPNTLLRLTCEVNSIPPVGTYTMLLDFGNPGQYQEIPGSNLTVLQSAQTPNPTVTQPNTTNNVKVNMPLVRTGGSDN